MLAVLAGLTALTSLLTAGPALAKQEPPPAQPPFQATVRAVDAATAAEMIGVSWHEGCPVPISDLRIIDMTHWDFDGNVAYGELVVNADVADAVVTVFRQMYDGHFPIRRMERVDVYGGSDDASMAADNTSAFNCRNKTGSTTSWSVHSYGRAIDINTVENPYVSGSTVLPPAGAAYLDRSDVRPGMIVDGDVVTRAFAKQKFDWGGDWHSLKDYQHFEIVPK